MRKYQSDINRIMSLIYEDQPIAPSKRAPLPVIPEKIRAIRSMGKGVAAYRQPREVIFLHQAQMISDYEDDFFYDREVRVWYPTYESLTDEQLRGYFGFRSRVRKGEIRKESRSYAFLYIYELLNLVGCDGPEDAFAKLTSFIDQYGALDPGILPYSEQWMIDFVLYNELEPALVRNRKPMIYDRKLQVLLEEEGRIRDGREAVSEKTGNRSYEQLKKLAEEKAKKDEALSSAILYLAGVNGGLMPSYLQDQELFAGVLAKTFRGMCRHYLLRRKTSLLEDFAGGGKNEPASLFAGAVFRDRSPVKGSGTFSGKRRCFDVVFSSVTSYHCEMGKWSVRTWRKNYNNPRFRELLKTVDCVIRTEQGETDAFPEGLPVKWIRSLIADAVIKLKKEREEAEGRRVDINLEMLSGIRSAAAETMEKLMTEEERGEAELKEVSEKPAEPDYIVGRPEEAKPAVDAELEAWQGIASEQPLEIEREKLPEGDAAAEKKETAGNPAETAEEKWIETGLTETEAAYLRWALRPETVEKPDLKNQILSVIVDSINEKLYDIFMDNVMEFGSAPEIIEDYREDLEEMFF